MQPTRWGSDPEFYGPRHLARLALIERWLVPRLAPGAAVLDVGSGAGRLVARLALRGFAAVGLEPSADFVAHAVARAPAGARFLQGEAAHLPFADGAFAAVVAGEVLEHLDDDAGALAEMARVLAPGGWCLLTVPADPALWDASDDWAGHRRRYMPEGLGALVTGAGLAVVAWRRWGFPLGALYHRGIFLRVLARKQAAGDRPSRPPGRGRGLVARALAALMALDGLWPRTRGPGLILLARKPG